MPSPSGVRFSSREIYSVFEQPEFAVHIDNAICVGQRRPQDEGEWMLLFIKMHLEQKLDQPLEQAIHSVIRLAPFFHMYIVETDKGDVPTWKFTFQLGDMQGAT